MAVLDAKEHVVLLKRAERQFRLMMAVRTACALGDQPLKVPITFTFGQNTVSGVELALQNDEAQHAAAILEHTTTYTLAIQIVQAMKDVLGSPREHADSGVQAPFEIARLVRNAYVHQPFRPHWSIDPACADSVFVVPDVIQLRTNGLHGQPVKWQGYGGMFAMFRLSQNVRSLLLPTENVTVAPEIARRVTKPGDVIQHGRLLLVAVDAIPDGATPIPSDVPIQINGPDGVYTIVGEIPGDAE
jgi:hypothetical protein